VIRTIERAIFAEIFARRFDQLLLSATIVAIGRATREQFALLSRHPLRGYAAKERMMLDALLPERLGCVTLLKVELDGVLVEAIVFRVEFDEEFLAFEGEFAYFGPGECVDFGQVLKDEYAHVGHRQVEEDAFVVFGRVHYYAVELDFSRYV
jgi:hypothetical protein